MFMYTSVTAKMKSHPGNKIFSLDENKTTALFLFSNAGLL